MTLKDDLQNRSPATVYRLWTRVTDGFLDNAQLRSNEAFQRIQLLDLVDQYRIGMSGDGNPPATHFGSSGEVEAPEAAEIAEFYAANTVDTVAWILTLDNELIWKNDTGIVPAPGPTAKDYLNDFIATLTPATQPLGDAAKPAAQLLFVITPVDQAGRVRTALANAAKVDDMLVRQLSADGRPPATHLAGLGVVRDPDAIKAAFPVTTGTLVDVLLLDKDQRLLWCNESGDAEDGKLTLRQFMRDENLQPIPKATVRARR